MSANKGLIPTEDDMRQAMVGLRGNSSMSVDQDFFSRIHDIAYGEKGNKDRLEHEEERLALLEEEEEKKKDTHDHLVDEVMTKIMEDRFDVGGTEVSLGDLQDALRKKGAEHYAKGIKDKDDKAEFLLIAEDIANGTATQSQIDRAMELSEEFRNDTLENNKRRLNQDEYTLNEQDTLKRNSFDEEYREESKIKETFKAEVDGVGPNNQSFVLDETPIVDVAVVETPKEDFFLDA